MSDLNFSVAQLIPEISYENLTNYSSPEGLSAIIFLFLIVITFAFLGVAFFEAYRSRRKLKFYRGLVDGINVDELVEKRRNICNTALQTHKDYGKLWKEFDESLVKPKDKERLFNTLDAAHFFNPYSIASGITDNRLLAAVPGFLTAIGVIGTFAGLQMGLSGLSLDLANDADISQLKNGIFAMISGASMAFITSVWGVICSVLFNFIEKIIERNIRRNIASFQNTIDYLFPRITAEQSLSNIEDTSRQSNQHLAELAEKIGNELQIALSKSSETIRSGMEESLNNILGPAITRLVENAQSGSENAMEALLERFLNRIGETGDLHKRQMETAANDVSHATASMAVELNGFVDRLENQMACMSKNNSEMMSELSNAVSTQIVNQKQLLDSSTEGVNSATGKMTGTLESFIHKFDEQLASIAIQNASALGNVNAKFATQAERQNMLDKERNDAISLQISRSGELQEKLSTRIEGIIESQSERSRELINALNEVHTSFQALAKSNTKASEEMAHSAGNLKASGNQLGLFSSSLKETTDLMGDKVIETAKIVDGISVQNRSIREDFGNLCSKLENLTDKAVSATGTMDTAVSKANLALIAVNDHFHELGNRLENHVEALDKEIGNLLRNYGDEVQSQTSNRMGEWVIQTNAYTGAMSDAINTLSSVVDEIDNKTNHIRRAS